MTDREFERIISFIVNENVVRRLLSSGDQSDESNGHDKPDAKDYTKCINFMKFLNWNIKNGIMNSIGVDVTDLISIGCNYGLE